MATYYNVITGSRIANSAWADQSGSDDTAVTGWAVGDDFILAVHMDDNSKNTEAGTYYLQWRKDGGSWNTLSNSGELTYSVGGATSLTNGSDLTSGEGICSNKQGSGWTWVNGTEREDSNDTVAFDGSDEDETEHAWAIATDNASAGSTYTFQTIDSANGNRADAIGVSITMAAGAIGITPDTATHSESAGQANMILQNVPISPDTGTHAHAAGQALVDTKFQIAPASGVHSISAGQALVNTKFQVAPAAGIHGHDADQAGASVVGQNEEISPDAGVHSQAAGQASINVIWAITPNSGTHAESADQAATNVIWAVSPNSAEHFTSAGSAAVDAIFKIEPVDGTHGHMSDQAAVNTVFQITPNNGVHVQSAGQALIDAIFQIAPDSGTHVHAAGQALVNTSFKIIPDTGTHLTAAGTAAIIQTWNIMPDNATHGYSYVPSVLVNIDTGGLGLRIGGVITEI